MKECRMDSVISNLSILVLPVLIVLVIWAYLPARKLLFRNDEWEIIELVEPRLKSFGGLIEFVSGSHHYIVKHFFPISHFIYYGWETVLIINFGFP